MFDDIKSLTWGEAGALLGAAIFCAACIIGALFFWWWALT